MIPFGDGPHPIYEHRVGKSVIQNMLSGATKYAWMTTPYLIIDNDLCTDLENAALRGVDVPLRYGQGFETGHGGNAGKVHSRYERNAENQPAAAVCLRSGKDFRAYAEKNLQTVP